MRFLRKLFGKSEATGPAAPEHAVLVHFQYDGTDLSPLFDLECELERAIAGAGVGELDGNEVASDGSRGTLYMYGRDGDALLATIRPALDECDFMKQARVVIRYGPPEDGVEEREIVLGT